MQSAIRVFLVGLSVSAIYALVHADRVGVAAEPAADSPRSVTTFSLSDVKGQAHTGDEWHGKQAVVLFFLGAECPVSNGYSPDMCKLAEEYAERGVVCYGVHVEPGLAAEDAARHAEEYGLTFPILLDPEQKLAGMVGARVTPDTVVVQPDGAVAYRGRIDNRYSVKGKRRDNPTKHELVDAIEAVLAGQAPAVSETEAYGCPLPRLPVAR
jgi:peroxiredoxin